MPTKKPHPRVTAAKKKTNIAKSIRSKTPWASKLAWLLAAAKTNLVMIVLCLFITTLAIQYGWNEHKLRNVSEQGYKTQGPVTTTTDALRTSSTWATRRELDELTKAVKVLGGNLIAGVKISLPEQSDSVTHDSLATTPTPETQERTAKFRDSTFAGTIEGTIKAPAYPAPLGIDYTVIRPEFSPQVGFVEKDGATYALVSWQGETYQVKNAYAPKVRKSKAVVPYTSLLYVADEPMVLQVGVETRSKLLGFGAVVAVDFQGGSQPRAMVGGKKEW